MVPFYIEKCDEVTLPGPYVPTGVWYLHFTRGVTHLVSTPCPPWSLCWAGSIWPFRDGNLLYTRKYLGPGRNPCTCTGAHLLLHTARQLEARLELEREMGGDKEKLIAEALKLPFSVSQSTSLPVLNKDSRKLHCWMEAPPNAWMRGDLSSLLCLGAGKD